MADVDYTPSSRIVICCDGTWCGPSTGTKTNTKILADSFASAGQQDEVDMYCHQSQRYKSCYTYYNAATDTHIMYMPGIGTSSSFIGYMVDAVLAIEIKQCCTMAYKFIVEHFRTNVGPNDPQTRIYMFGHSRGAFTVRTVAGMTRNCGILNGNNSSVRISLPELLDEVYMMYTNKDKMYRPDQPAARDFRVRLAHCDPGSDRLSQPPIEFMGLLDTVGALGVPKLNSGPGVAYELYDTDVSKDVLHVWQALAVHDRLTVFTPCHITRKESEAQSNGHTLTEVWMPGSHYDIGRQKFVFLREAGGWESVLSYVNRYLDPLCINITPNKELADLALLELLRALYGASADARGLLCENPVDRRNNSKLKQRYLNRTYDEPDNLLEHVGNGVGNTVSGVLRRCGLKGEEVSQDAYDNIANRLGSAGLMAVPPVLLPGGAVGNILTSIIKNMVTTCLPIVLADRHIPLYGEAKFVSTRNLHHTNYMRSSTEGPFRSKAFQTYLASSGRNIDGNGVVCNRDDNGAGVPEAAEAAGPNVDANGAGVSEENAKNPHALLPRRWSEHFPFTRMVNWIVRGVLH